jgi:hypothetical protein
MKQGKRVKPVFPIEYRLLITPKYKEREKRFVTYAAIRTVNEFSSFRYEIIVDPTVTDRVLQFNIHGLRAPQVTIPHSGPAIFETEFLDLRGTYDLVISKLGREKNTFTISISNKEIILKESPQDKFVDVTTSANEF